LVGLGDGLGDGLVLVLGLVVGSGVLLLGCGLLVAGLGLVLDDGLLVTLGLLPGDGLVLGFGLLLVGAGVGLVLCEPVGPGAGLVLADAAEWLALATVIPVSGPAFSAEATLVAAGRLAHGLLAACAGVAFGPVSSMPASPTDSTAVPASAPNVIDPACRFLTVWASPRLMC